MKYILLIISTVFVNNIVLSKFLGICPFIGVSKRVNTAIGMTGAVTFVLVLSTIITYLIHAKVLKVLSLEFMQTITFILIIAALVQIVEIILKKVSPPLYYALGIYLPLITTNCAVLGVALLTIKNNYNLIEGVIYSFANAVGFGLALIVFSGIREQLDLVDIPKDMQGVPIAFIVAGILAMAFMGFANIV